MSELLKINYDKIKLHNGLDVVLYKDSSLPLTAVNIWYKVGSANERKGKTGFAHLFEHMMFQGSKHVPKEMHFKYIEEVGGSLNGSTGLDRTNYYETVPSNYLDLALWLESDRMGFLLPALTQEKLDNQKSVVMNERRQRYDNQPYGLAWEKIFSNLFPENHPYHWPTIGWMKDIEEFNLEDVKDFFHTYYSPSNASLVIAGDIDPVATMDSVKKYFDNIPPVNSIPVIEAPVTELNENIFIEYNDNVQLSRIYMAWHSDKAYNPDDAKLDILADVMSGTKNSRLHKSLVFEKQLAQDVTCFQYSASLASVFVIVATARPGISLEAIKDEIFAEIDKLVKEGVEESELKRSLNATKSSFIYSLQNLDNMANQINNYNCQLGNPDSFIYDLDRYGKVTSGMIAETAEKYLGKPYVQLNIIPKNNG